MREMLSVFWGICGARGRFAGLCGLVRATGQGVARSFVAVLVVLGASFSAACADSVPPCDPNYPKCLPEAVRAVPYVGADELARLVEGDPEVDWTGIVPGEAYELLHYVAADAKDAELVDLLIEKGADVNVRDRYYAYTPLHYAARNGNPAIAAALIARGADLEARGTNGNTPFLTAAARWYGGTARILEVLAEAGADTAVVDLNGNTALHLATARGKSPEVVTYLIEGGADVNVQNNDGDTPLHRAMEPVRTRYDTEFWVNMIKMISVLIDNGADTTITNRAGRNALESGARDEFAAFTGLMLGEDCDGEKSSVCFGVDWNTATVADVWNIDVEQFDKRLGMPLHYAVMHDSPDSVVEYLIESGAEVYFDSLYEIYDYHPAFSPADMYKRKHGQVLGAMQKFPEYCDGLPDRISPCFGVDWESATVADARKANLLWVNATGFTPFHYASAASDMEVVRDMLVRGANAHRPADVGFDSYTPLALAAMYNSSEVVSVLLTHGVNPRAAKADPNNTPMHFAAGHQNEAEKNKIVLMLANAAPDTVYARAHLGEISLPFLVQNPDVLIRLTEMVGVGALNLVSRDGLSALDRAKKSENPQIKAWIAERGYDKADPPAEFLLLESGGIESVDSSELTLSYAGENHG